MSEFAEVMKNWKRMCSGRLRGKCPLAAKFQMSNCAICKDTVFNAFEEAETIIMTWAAEHLEPMYPTWKEWLLSVGVISPGVAKDNWLDHNGRFNSPISSNIAQKLGICQKDDADAQIEASRPTDTMQMDWLNEKERQAELAVFFCRGDAQKNVEVLHSIRVVKDLWQKDQAANR